MAIGYGNYAYGAFTYGHGTENVVATVTGNEVSITVASPLSATGGATTSVTSQLLTYSLADVSVTGDAQTSATTQVVTYSLGTLTVIANANVSVSGLQQTFSLANVSIGANADAIVSGFQLDVTVNYNTGFGLWTRKLEDQTTESWIKVA